MGAPKNFRDNFLHQAPLQVSVFFNGPLNTASYDTLQVANCRWVALHYGFIADSSNKPAKVRDAPLDFREG